MQTETSQGGGVQRFGIGCWSLEPNDGSAPELQTEPSTYQAGVIQTLQAIPTIKNVAVTKFSFATFAGEKNEPFWAPKDRTAHLLERPRFRPHPYRGTVTFDIEVPASFINAQPLLASRLSDKDQLFRVEMRYTENFPVTFVTSKSDDAERGSAGVIAAREFILSELKLRDTPLGLTVLGPSPFWADCSVECSNERSPDRDDVVTYERSSRRLGYDVLAFTCAQNLADEDAARTKVFDYIEPELGLYYQLINWENRRTAAWYSLQSDLDMLLRLHEVEGMKVMAQRWLRAGRLSRRLSLSLLKEEARAANDINTGKRLQLEVNAVTSSRIFQSDLESLYDLANTDYPGAQSMVTMLDARRRYDVNLAAVIVSSTLGGVAGAAITAVAGGGG